MSKLKMLLRNRNVIFVIGLLGGLLFPHASPLTRHLVLPALALAMALSTMEIDSGVFRRPRSLLFPALIGIVMNYVILGNVIIGLAALMIIDEMTWIGFVLLASVPPAVAVIPFSGFLKGNGLLSLMGTAGAYVGALLIMPLMALGLLSTTELDPFKLVLITLELIVLPLAVSRWLIQKGIREKIDPYRGTVTNWSFFLVIYTLIALNRSVILGQTLHLAPIASISVLTMFLLGHLIDWISSLFHLPKDTRTSLVLLGTLKNQGLAGGVALTLFSQEAALPSAVSTIVMILYVVWLDYKQRWD